MKKSFRYYVIANEKGELLTGFFYRKMDLVSYYFLDLNDEENSILEVTLYNSLEEAEEAKENLLNRKDLNLRILQLDLNWSLSELILGPLNQSELKKDK